MTKIRVQTQDIRCFILKHVDDYPADIAKKVVEQFRISRQAVNKHLQKLVDEKLLVMQGKTQNRTYKLAVISEQTFTYEVIPSLAEDLVWQNDIRPSLGIMPENVLQIWHYGFTEMFNNVLDHSEASKINVEIRRTAMNTQMLLADNGVGIFKKIQTSLNLLDRRHALLELSKGKLTTDPKKHSGEGIFFTSRMFDSYDIVSEGVHFSHKFEHPEDWILEINDAYIGTTIWMKLDNQTIRTAKEIFDQYTTDDDYGFNKTVVPVKLAQYGEDLLISRSQAKRL